MDPGIGVGGLVKIVEVALQIKEVAGKVSQNKVDCDQMKDRVEMLCNTVQQLREKAGVMNTEVMQFALKRTESVLDEALRVVTDCQEERNIVCLIYTAGKLSKELSKVDGRITSVSTDVMTAVQVCIAPGPSPPCHTRKVPVEVAHSCGCGGIYRTAPRTHTARNVVWTNSEQLSLPQQIIEVSLEIKEAMKTVYRNKDFIEIEKRASSVIAVMSLLENYTELVNQERTRAALQKLLGTFNQARTLVMSYPGIRIDLILWPNGKLGKEVRTMLDLMFCDINAVNLIAMQTVQREQ